MMTITTRSMPSYFTKKQTRFATLGFSLLPFLSPALLWNVSAQVMDPALFVLTAGFWLASTSVLLSLAIPSLAIGNAYRQKLRSMTHSPRRLAVWFRPDSQLRTMFWGNLVTTLVAAGMLYHLFVTIYGA